MPQKALTDVAVVRLELVARLDFQQVLYLSRYVNIPRKWCANVTILKPLESFLVAEYPMTSLCILADMYLVLVRNAKVLTTN